MLLSALYLYFSFIYVSKYPFVDTNVGLLFLLVSYCYGNFADFIDENEKLTFTICKSQSPYYDVYAGKVSQLQ